MRTSYLHALILVLIGSGMLNGQTIVKTNVLAPIVGGASLAVEIAAPANKSVLLDASFGNTPLLIPNDRYMFQSLQAQLRLYRQSPGPMQGRYLNPYVKYMHREIFQEAVPGSWLFPGKAYRHFDGHSIGAGLGIGRQGVLAKRLLLDISVGLGYLVYIAAQEQGGDSDQEGHLDANVSISLGYLTRRVVLAKDR